MRDMIMLSAFHEQGGNTLQRFLDSHPNLFVYPFESQISTPHSANVISGPGCAMPQRYAYPEFLSGTTPEQAYNSMWDEELKTYLRAPHRSKFKDCGLEMNESERKEAFIRACTTNSRGNFVEAFFASTFEAWKNFKRTGKETHYVGYVPPILFDADKFFADFPNGKMVHIIRNPFSGYADTKKRPFPMSLTKYCQVWNFCCLQAQIYAEKYDTSFIMLRYEDLLVDPAYMLNKLSRLLELDVTDHFGADASPSFNRTPMKEVYPWGTIKTPTTEANLATARELSRDEYSRIYTETKPILEICGYTELGQ